MNEESSCNSKNNTIPPNILRRRKSKKILIGFEGMVIERWIQREYVSLAPNAKAHIPHNKRTMAIASFPSR